MSESTVRLQIPAASGYLVLARTAVAALCARLDYPLDRLEDVKLAVDEACSLLLSDAKDDSVIELALTAGADGLLTIAATAATKQGRAPKQTSFAWTVLTALVDSVTASAADGLVTIELTASRAGNESAVGA